MPRQRSPNRDKAFEIWRDSKGVKPLVEIAEELGVKDTQIRKWKSQDKWEDQFKGTLPKNKSNVTNKNKVTKKEKSVIEKVVEESNIEDTELTEKQYLFCMYYVKCWNATKAYQKAYGCDYNTANAHGYKLLSNVVVKQEIDKLKQSIRDGVYLEAMAVFQKYIDIAFADITDFVSFHQEEVPVMTAFGPLEVKNPKTGKKEVVTKMVNTVKFKDSTEVDGTILTEVSQGKDGAKIKLADKMKALEKLDKYFDLIPDTWKRKIEEEKLKIDKAKVFGEGEGNDNSGVKEFIAATSMSEEEIKSIFEGDEDEDIQEED